MLNSDFNWVTIWKCFACFVIVSMNLYSTCWRETPSKTCSFVFAMFLHDNRGKKDWVVLYCPVWFLLPVIKEDQHVKIQGQYSKGDQWETKVWLESWTILSYLIMSNGFFNELLNNVFLILQTIKLACLPTAAFANSCICNFIWIVI